MEEKSAIIHRSADALFQHSPHPTFLRNITRNVEDSNVVFIAPICFDRDRVPSMIVKNFNGTPAASEGFEEANKFRYIVTRESAFDFSLSVERCSSPDSPPTQPPANRSPVEASQSSSLSQRCEFGIEEAVSFTTGSHLPEI